MIFSDTGDGIYGNSGSPCEGVGSPFTTVKPAKRPADKLVTRGFAKTRQKPIQSVKPVLARQDVEAFELAPSIFGPSPEASLTARNVFSVPVAKKNLTKRGRFSPKFVRSSFEVLKETPEFDAVSGTYFAGEPALGQIDLDQIKSVIAAGGDPVKALEQFQAQQDQKAASSEGGFLQTIINTALQNSDKIAAAIQSFRNAGDQSTADRLKAALAAATASQQTQQNIAAQFGPSPQVTTPAPAGMDTGTVLLIAGGGLAALTIAILLLKG